jgi:negative regulator of flagellin synthesis FlgM
MADKINGYGRVGVDVGTARSRAVSRPEREGDTGTTRGASESRDAVEITDTATRLKAVEAKLSQLPDVDQARVEAIRKQVESGSYRPDAARIAQKLMRMEQDL